MYNPPLVPFERLSIAVQEIWMRKAVEHLDRTHVSYSEHDQDVVFYMTAVYLYQLSDFSINRMKYPCYVVHCCEEGWRFVTDSAKLAFGRFKRTANRSAKYGGNRVAMFYWKGPAECVKKYETEGYPFEIDFIPG